MDEPDQKRLSLYLDVETWKALKLLAIAKNTHQHKLVLDGISWVFKQHGIQPTAYLTERGSSCAPAEQPEDHTTATTERAEIRDLRAMIAAKEGQILALEDAEYQGSGKALGEALTRLKANLETALVFEKHQLAWEIVSPGQFSIQFGGKKYLYYPSKGSWRVFPSRGKTYYCRDGAEHFVLKYLLREAA